MPSLKNACKLKLYHERGPEDTQIDQTGIPLHENQQVPLPDQTTPQQPADKQSTAQRPVQNKTNKTDQLKEEYRSALTDDIRILRAKRTGQKQWFHVLWPDNHRDWIHEPYVNKRIIHEYLKTHTKQGKKRKLKSRFFTRSRNA